MRWNECLKRNLVERKRRDKKLSFSLMKMAEKRIEFFASRRFLSLFWREFMRPFLSYAMLFLRWKV